MHPVGTRPPGGPARRPKPIVRMPLGCDPHAPSAARHALSELRGELGDARYRVCELLVSELVTNVVVHTSPARSLAAADMRVRLYGDRVRVEVRDDRLAHAIVVRLDGVVATDAGGADEARRAQHRGHLEQLPVIEPRGESGSVVAYRQARDCGELEEATRRGLQPIDAAPERVVEAHAARGAGLARAGRLRR